MLERRVRRWEHGALELGGDPDSVRAEAQAARTVIRTIVADLVAAAALDDKVFAESRARAWVRAGRSRRAIALNLARRGIDADTGRTAIEAVAAERLEDPSVLELAAALVQTRRRRIGPFAPGGLPDDGESRAAARLRSLAALARAGFSHDCAVQALDTDRETAERLIALLRT